MQSYKYPPEGLTKELICEKLSAQNNELYPLDADKSHFQRLYKTKSKPTNDNTRRPEDIITKLNRLYIDGETIVACGEKNK